MRILVRFLAFFWRGLVLLLVLLVLLMATALWTASQRETVPLGVLPELGGTFVKTRLGLIYTLERGPGTGVPLLFAHGTGAWSGLWLPTLEVAGAAGYRAIAFDMPPFGFSEHPETPDYSRQTQAARIIALLEALEIRPIIVAHSIGAGPMSEAVLMRPDLVSGFVIVDGAIALNSHEAPKSLPPPLRNATLRRAGTAASLANPWLTGWLVRKFVYVKEAITPQIVEVLQAPQSREGYTRAAADWVPQLLETPVDALSTRPENWTQLALPTVLIWGAEDTITPPVQATDLMEHLQAGTLVMLNGVGHIPQIEAPKDFYKALLEALDLIKTKISAEDEI